jgi:hypothetical protein
MIRRFSRQILMAYWLQSTSLIISYQDKERSMKASVAVVDSMVTTRQETVQEIPRALHVPEDTEVQGFGRGLGALIGGGTAMAFTAYLASLYFLPYVKDEINLLTGFGIAIVSYAIVAFGAWVGYVVVKWVEERG